MHDIYFDKKNKPFLKWTKRLRNPGETGIWVEIGKYDEKDIENIIRMNQAIGYEAIIDERGYYRVLVLKE